MKAVRSRVGAGGAAPTSHRAGFSLVELLVVIAIIGILSSLLLPALGRGKEAARSAACLSNLHQTGLALMVYVDDSGDRLPICAGYLPSQQPQLPSLAATLFPLQATNPVFHCPSDRRLFPVERTSYEWNFWLNGAPYSAPQWAAIHTNEALVIVNQLFGSREDTPLTGDANANHAAGGHSQGKNALYFDGRVQRVRLP